MEKCIRRLLQIARQASKETKIEILRFKIKTKTPLRIYMRFVRFKSIDQSTVILTDQYTFTQCLSLAYPGMFLSIPHLGIELWSTMCIGNVYWLRSEVVRADEG